MRLPRDVTGVQLVKALRVLGYEISRQSGSHIRISTEKNGTHHVTIPNHDPIKLGTFASILDDIAGHHKLQRSELVRLLKI